MSDFCTFVGIFWSPFITWMLLSATFTVRIIQLRELLNAFVGINLPDRPWRIARLGKKWFRYQFLDLYSSVVWFTLVTIPVFYMCEFSRLFTLVYWLGNVLVLIEIDCLVGLVVDLIEYRYDEETGRHMIYSP